MTTSFATHSFPIRCLFEFVAGPSRNIRAQGARSHRAILALVTTALIATTASAQGLITNASFAAQVEGWQMDAAGQAIYSVTNADGYTDNTSLRYEVVAKTDGGPVTQTFDCTANTDYVITVALKSNGRINPLVRVLDPGRARVLAGVITRKETIWTCYAERFNSGPAAKLQVQIFGDSALSNGGKAGVGITGVDDVQVYAADQLPDGLRPADLYLPPGRNIALGRPYTYKPRAGYPYCSDAGDATQLTDGLLTVGYFWTQKSTVGWMRTGPVSLTIDLGKVQPIAGLSFRSVAGVAGVRYPDTVHVFTSDDDKQWWLAGELINLSERELGPPAEGYRTHRFAVSDLNTHGRYVRLIISYFPFAFCDEIEVYRGADELLTRAPKGMQMSGTTDFVKEAVVFGAIGWRMRTDLAAAREAIGAAKLADAERAVLLARATGVAAAIEALPPRVPKGFQTILPLDDLHASIYALNAAVLRARGFSALTAWAQNRWDTLAPTQAPAAPPESPPSLRVDMISGEYRAEVINLTNATDEPLAAKVGVSGLPDGDNPGYLTIRQVLFTDTRNRQPIAAALPDARRTGAGYTIDVPTGTTRQIWLAFRPADVPAGEYSGQVTVTAPGQPEIVMPIKLKIYPFSFPERSTLSLGGWDYMSSNGMYGVTPANMPALIEALSEYYVDTPWASRSVLPTGAEFDGRGRLVSELGFTTWDRWVSRFPNARHYAVFMRANATPDFHGEPLGTERFSRMVGDWITAWVEHLATQGIEPSRLSLLIVDEPGKPEQTKMIVAYARAMKAVQPEVVIWLDPRYKDPGSEDPELWKLCDVLCPNTYVTARCPEAERQFYLDQRARGTDLWLYDCSGPGKGLDPYAYHRGQQWMALRFGAVGCGYWAFGSAGGNKSTSWNAYDQDSVEYSPLFIGADSVTPGKHMEAIREGVQDYEYFVMLRKRVAALKAKRVTAPAVARAEKLLTEGPLRVTDAIIADGGVGWSPKRDRTIMDQVRVEVLDALVELAEM